MIFPSLLIKHCSNGEIKLVNLSNEDEAIADQKALDLLISMSKKADRSTCTDDEFYLLAALEDNFEIKPIDGCDELVVRSGNLDGLDIYLTNVCNLSCKHCCMYEETHHAPKNEIDFDLLKQTILESEELGLFKLKLSGGEPFAYYRIKELLAFLKDRAIHTTIISNGTLLNEYLSDLDNSKLSFCISLDGFEESHDFLRGAGSFAITSRNIEAATNAGFEVEVNMVVYDRNQADIEKFAEYVKSIGANRLNIQVLRPLGMALELLSKNLVKDEKFLREIHQGELQAQATKIENGKEFCTSCKTGLSIDHKSNVIGCTFLSEEPVGNLATASLRELHEKSLKENPLTDVEILAECSKCELFNIVCAGGCRARAKILTGSIHGCDYWIPFLLNHPKFNECNKQPYEFLLI